jgi:RNA polymerase sigma-70 factor, ECF subfamily
VNRVLDATGGPSLAPEATLEAFLARRIAAAGGETLDQGGLALAFRASRGEPGAVEEVAKLLSGLRGALRRTGAQEAEVEELVAELPAELLAPREGALPRILGYSGKGALGAWLRVVAVRMLVERRRKQRPEGALEEEVGERVSDAHDPELELLRRTYRAELERAFKQAFGSLEPNARLLLVQHHVDGLGVDQLAALHGVHRATAARRVAAARDAFSEEVRAVLSRELAVGGETYESIVRLVRSDLSLHLSRYR